jgi:hypothetical protein
MLAKVADAHGITSKFFLETDADFERRIVRTFYKRTLTQLSPEQKRHYLASLRAESGKVPNLAAEGTGAASIVLAQASGFGIYQMATTVTGAASAAAGITIPFVGYMILTKSIFLLIGPLGWITLGASALHKITKPDYEQMVAVVAWMSMVRAGVSKTRSWGDYSVSELLRKSFKTVTCAALLVLFMVIYERQSQQPIANRQDARSITGSVPPVSDATGQTMAENSRESALANALGSNSLTWIPGDQGGFEALSAWNGQAVTASVVLDKTLAKDARGDTHLVILSNSPDEYGCDACAVLLSAFVFRVKGGTWSLLMGNRYFSMGGNWGKPPGLSVIKLGRSTWGLVQSDRSMHQGLEEDVDAIYKIGTSNIDKVLRIQLNGDSDYPLNDAVYAELGTTFRSSDPPQYNPKSTLYKVMRSDKEIYDISLSSRSNDPSQPVDPNAAKSCRFNGTKYECSSLAGIAPGVSPVEP